MLSTAIVEARRPLLIVAAQLADLATFEVAARLLGPAGELGPLGSVYAAAGFAPVVMAKLLGIAAILCVLALYRLRVGASPVRLALLAAAVGLFGATTNLVAILGFLD